MREVTFSANHRRPGRSRRQQTCLNGLFSARVFFVFPKNAPQLIISSGLPSILAFYSHDCFKQFPPPRPIPEICWRRGDPIAGFIAPQRLQTRSSGWIFHAGTAEPTEVPRDIGGSGKRTGRTIIDY